MFLKVDRKTPEVVVSSEGLHSTSIVKDKTGIIKQAAEYLQEEILEHASNTDTLDCHPPPPPPPPPSPSIRTDKKTLKRISQPILVNS